MLISETNILLFCPKNKYAANPGILPNFLFVAGIIYFLIIENSPLYSSLIIDDALPGIESSC